MPQQLIIEPRDTLLFRDGKEFGADSNGATTLAFPLPSVLAGAIRTRIGLLNGDDFNEPHVREKLLGISIRSPILARLADEQSPQEFYFPAPADAVVFGTKDSQEVEPLFPQRLASGTQTDPALDGLLPLGLAAPNKQKPYGQAARFWGYDQRFKKWLVKAAPFKGEQGLSGPQREGRVHTRMTPEGTVKDGQLFSTEMLRFTESGSGGSLSQARRLALMALVDAEKPRISGLYPLGGERRLAHWSSQQPTLPELPSDLITALKKNRQARLILATPGYFAHQAWRPQTFGDGVELKAAALRGYTVASGWDLAAGQPKPSRRLAPAGSVYYLQLPASWNDKQVEEWAQRHWFGSLGDDEQSIRDGFGVCLVGSWTQEISEIGKGVNS